MIAKIYETDLERECFEQKRFESRLISYPALWE